MGLIACGYALLHLRTGTWADGSTGWHCSARTSLLDHLVEVVRSERVDAVLLASDVYDRAVPPPESTALRRRADPGRRRGRRWSSSGNHDSAVRLASGAGLLSRAGVRMCTTTAGVGKPVLVGDVAVYALPYPSPPSPATTSERPSGPMRAPCGPRWRGCGRTPPVVARRRRLGARLRRRGLSSESERDISVGGSAQSRRRSSPAPTSSPSAICTGPRPSPRRSATAGSPWRCRFRRGRPGQGQPPVGHRGRASGARVRGEFVTAPVERPLRVLRGELAALPRRPCAARGRGGIPPGRPHRPGATGGCARPGAGPLPAHAAAGVPAQRHRCRPPHPYAARTAERGPVEVCDDFLGHVRGGRGASAAERAVLVEASTPLAWSGPRSTTLLGGSSAPRGGCMRIHRLELLAWGPSRARSSSTSTPWRPRVSTSSTGPPGRVRPRCSTPCPSRCTPPCPGRVGPAAGWQ